MIFAGDQKQLPPSNFFRVHSQDDDNYNDDDDEPEDTLGRLREHTRRGGRTWSALRSRKHTSTSTTAAGMKP